MLQDGRSRATGKQASSSSNPSTHPHPGLLVLPVLPMLPYFQAFAQQFPVPRSLLPCLPAAWCHPPVSAQMSPPLRGDSYPAEASPYPLYFLALTSST